MKKILFAALAVLAITSCSQNEEIEAPTQKTEINFRSVVGKSSRAAEATTENLESQGFILYAYNTKTITMDKVTAGSLTTTFINGKKATCTNSNWSVADGPYYWPIAENLHFQQRLHYWFLLYLLHRRLVNLSVSSEEYT